VIEQPGLFDDGLGRGGIAHRTQRSRGVRRVVPLWHRAGQRGRQHSTRRRV